MVQKITATDCVTPQSIANTPTKYSIPMYQRLFEWRRDAVRGLMIDLYNSYKKREGTERYYIGMVTSTAKNELVDGQQRFSVLMLLGIQFKDLCSDAEVKAGWESFLLVNEKPRIHYEARDEDNDYLADKIKGINPSDYINQRMEDGLDEIQKVMKNDIPSEEYDSYIKYVFEKTSLFISELPGNYQPKELNKYFEAMNSTGKNLENHEILKVRLISKLPESCNKEYYTRVWNAVSDLDRKLVHQKRSQNESVEAFRDRFKNAIGLTKDGNDYDLDSFFKKDYVNDFKGDERYGEDTESIRIRDIQEPPADQLKEPKDDRGFEGYRSILSFSEFLLQVLYITNKPDPSVKNITDFFDVNKLLATFDDCLKSDSDVFIRNLLHYRLLYDYYLIRIADKSENYSLEMFVEGLQDSKEDLIMYESMMYVASGSKSYYLWIPDLLEEVSRKTDYNYSDLFEWLRIKDDNIRENSPKGNANRADLDNPQEKMTYDHIDRYWFWRLDFYIWKNRKDLFDKDNYFRNFKQLSSLVDDYTFKRNRSIEHVSPQHPEDKDPIQNLDSFGNLVMISSSMNSRLSRSEYQVKMGYIKDCLEKKEPLDSLSMMLLYSNNERWGEEQVIQREKEMIRVLKASFDVENHRNIISENSVEVID